MFFLNFLMFKCSYFQESSVAKLGSVCRRVYRIFSHAYFHHRLGSFPSKDEDWRAMKLNYLPISIAFFSARQIFDVFENESHLCRRFTVFVTKYNLMSKVCSHLKIGFLEESLYMHCHPYKVSRDFLSYHWRIVNWANILNFFLLRTTWLYRCLSKKLVQEENPRPKTWLIKITTSTGIFLSEEPGSSH